MNQIVKDAYHMPITCAKEGQLSVNLNDNQRALVLLTPEKTLDKGFAMTSSFSCMMLYALLIFDENKNIDEKSEYIHEAAKSAQKIIDDEKFFDNLQAKKFNRVIYLGSGVFGYLTKEARLKILELSAGQI